MFTVGQDVYVIDDTTGRPSRRGTVTKIACHWRGDWKMYRVGKVYWYFATELKDVQRGL